MSEELQKYLLDPVEKCISDRLDHFEIERKRLEERIELLESDEKKIVNRLQDCERKNKSWMREHESLENEYQEFRNNTFTRLSKLERFQDMLSDELIKKALTNINYRG